MPPIAAEQTSAPFKAPQPGHILFITGEYPPMPGGVGAYTAEVAVALIRRGWRASVLTSVGAQAESIARRGVEVYPVMRQWGWNMLGDGVKWARKLGADWLHVQYQTAAFALHPAINAAPAWWRREGMQVAWTYHDISVPYMFPKAGKRLRRWVAEWPARVCDLTITTNAGDESQLAPIARNLAVIPIGSNIPTRLLTPSERRARRALRGYGETDVVIGYFGFLNRSKGGLNLVQTVARLLHDLPMVRLLLIGEQVGASDSSNFAYLQAVKAEIQKLGLEDRVLWTGYQPDAEVSADLVACDLLLLPYLDGASLRRGSLMAGLAHGCAIVTTTPSAPIPELVEGRDLVYVPPGDIEMAADVVLKLVRDSQQLAMLGKNALAASTTFSWEGIAAEHERLYWEKSRLMLS